VLESIQLPLNDRSYLTIISLRLYLFFLYQIHSPHYSLQHCCTRYSADMAQMNASRGSYDYDIASSATNWSAASWYNRISSNYICSSSWYCTYGDSYPPWSITNSVWILPTPVLLSRSQMYCVLHFLNAAPILYHAVAEILEHSHIITKLGQSYPGAHGLT